jgi:hypothetical protein
MQEKDLHLIRNSVQSSSVINAAYNKGLGGILSRALDILIRDIIKIRSQR